MTRAGRLTIVALGALVSVAAFPAAAQVVVGESRPSVEVNWDLLDKLGPEPTLPGLLTRRPAAPAKPKAATGTQGPVYKPYGGGDGAKVAVAAPRPRPAKAPVAASVPPAVPVSTAPATTPTPAPAAAAPDSGPTASKPQDVAGVPSEERPRMPAQPAKPPRADVAADVPPPPKSDVKAKSRASTPVVATELPTPPAAPAAAAPVKAEPPKAETPPAAVQFVKPVEAPVAPPAPVAPAAPVAAPAAPPPAPVVAAPAPVTPPAPPAVASAPPQQLASLPPATGGSVRKGDNLSVLFTAESSHLPESVRGDLDRLAQKLERDEALSLQLLAYAAGDEANASKARRLSLSRALEVRKYLMEMGVRSTRIEVRALGNKIEGGAADRVDALLVSR